MVSLDSPFLNSFIMKPKPFHSAQQDATLCVIVPGVETEAERSHTKDDLTIVTGEVLPSFIL